ncbi:hypothetical protein EGW08_015280 [Elysia chlorotica]|uniref:G-protein coupled receptors family 1 profile domain-containing protein n=1 Tax=Elysia chlorotica TaxID=188477 RepID=A0A3S1B7J8_ELYCH|nr:hypothetical protein EGW08_015280 [Elysia chlorotica]
MPSSNVSDTESKELGFFLQEDTFLRKYIYHVWLCILIFGLGANSINIAVFTKIGLRDNVTLTLLVLSFSDLIHLILSFPIAVARFIEKYHPYHDWPFHPKILFDGIYWWAFIFYDYSSFISVFLGLVRCACVSRPLRFKSMFTISRTVKVLVLLFLLALGLRAPVLTVFRLTWELNPITNSTYRSIRFSANYKEIYKANHIFNMNIVSWTTYVIAVGCVIVLTSNLKAASRFRQSSQNASSDSSENNQSETATVNKQRSTNSVKKKPANKMSVRDLQVIKSVTLLCVVFIVSQLPPQIRCTIRLIDPEFSEFGRKRFALGFSAQVSRTFGFLNASVNIFIHYYFNRRYRDTFLFTLSKMMCLHLGVEREPVH